MQETIKQSGGYREGAGRKKSTAKRIGFRAPQDIVDILEAEGNMTSFICDAIRAYKG